MPGAVSLPVLSDAERARVGTIYTQDSPFTARKIGATLVARNAARHIETALQDHDGAWRPLVYCWRGGQRSGAFATILRQIGWRSETVEGGYRSFRRLVVRALYDDPWPVPVVLLDGNTGTAKTELLQRVADRGGQVLDLEGLAGHRGSIFGELPAGQPSQKAFETGIAMALARLDPGRPVLVEAESARIGARMLPPGLWMAMRAAPRIEISAPVPERAAYLARAYSDVARDPAMLNGHLDRLVPYHGHEAVMGWRKLAEAGATVALAEALVRDHYDPRYAKSRARGETAGRTQLDTDSLDAPALDGLATQIAGQIR